MFVPPVKWREMPATAQWGIALWVLAWACLLGDFYLLTHDPGWVGKLVIAVGLLAYFLLSGQNWARMIALMAGGMAILFSAVLVYAMRNDTIALLISAASLVLFGMSISYLFAKTTSRFFKVSDEKEPKE